MTIREKLVAIEHKELGLKSKVLESTLSAWIHGGWTPVDDVDSAVQEPLPDVHTDVPAAPDANEE